MSVVEHEQETDGTIIKVIGVGGGGGNAVTNMVRRHFQGPELICANTDLQVLHKTGAHRVIVLGDSGLGAGANPEVGRECAKEARKKIAEALTGAHMVFVTAGMGGGTGTGAAPVVAEIAREMGILTVGVVTKPFEFEGPRRTKQANQGLAELEKHVDSLIVVLNDRLLDVLGEDITQTEAFQAADDVLFNAVSGITEIIQCPGVVNVDFQDVRTVMSNKGRAMMGYGYASGPNRAEAAAEMAIACPLLEGVNLSGAKGLLVNITASEATLKIKEPKRVMEIIGRHVDEEATIIYGAVYDNSLEDSLRVTVVATGLDDHKPAAARVQPQAQAQTPAPAPVAAAPQMHPLVSKPKAPVGLERPERAHGEARAPEAPAGLWDKERDFSAYEAPSVFRPRDARFVTPQAAPAPAAAPVSAAPVAEPAPEAGAKTEPRFKSMFSKGELGTVPAFLRK
ncbi:cell division protein FtsZ [Paraburkholderia sp. UCT31]|uniref:cell division protein FtsZ n=1 Tax=Paraburkholderia sp. UCT31 TaxID=2615209 RepID=UPI0016557DE3|nr:cell division protein FtsZ [Paraburkholderia sp. UCT31]MBC8737299.1 cell division protein FtsZ [Paraburkholderia sp. UCT31]